MVWDYLHLAIAVLLLLLLPDLLLLVGFLFLGGFLLVVDQGHLVVGLVMYCLVIHPHWQQIWLLSWCLAFAGAPVWGVGVGG